MPPHVPDSDDEDAEDLTAQAEDENERWVPSGNGSDEAALAPVTDSNGDPSSRSTERLQRQIRSAELSLFATAENQTIATSGEQPTTSAMVEQTGSPTTRCTKKRRSTNERESQGVREQHSSMERTKTFSSAKRTGDDGSLSALRNGDVFDQCNTPLDLAQHEPVMMFRDSGSTVPDDESQQQAMIEIAKKKNEARAPAAQRQPSEVNPQSSVFPWTASQPTQSTRIAKTQEGGGEEDSHEIHGATDADLFEGSVVGPSQILHDIDSIAQSALQPNTQDFMAEVTETTLVKRQSSPIVRVPIKSVTQTSAKDLSTNTSSNRKQKVSNDPITTLSSDEIAIGLPKEQYKPRPSKRRAASMDDEQVDLSVIPGKKKRVKRTKTGPAAVTGGNATIAGNAAAPQPPIEPADDSTMKPARKCDDVESDHIEISKKGDAHTPDTIDDRKVSSTNEDAAPKAESPVKDAGPVFAVPSAKPKSGSRMKRSQTTIFEDHVEFSASQRAPNLSQQQAKRQSALQDMKNECRPAGKKRRIIEDDDDVDDDEDELAREHDSHKVEANEQNVGSPETTTKEPKKKKGRGRPKKAAVPESKMKSKEFVLEDSEEEKESEAEEAPTKKKRGHPAKSKAVTPAETEVDEDGVVPLIDHIPEVAKPATPEEPKRATQEPTPSPEKAAPAVETNTATKKTKQPTTTTHSPIKRALLVPYRVGLSRSHRIPSLLRTMKPPVKR